MSLVSRRDVLGAPALLMQSGPSVTVVGAGAFGGWTALHLHRMGARVTLLDAWGPGNSRASSGGETRITRAAYADAIYAEWTVRALQLWKENERRWNRKIFVPCGVVRLEGRGSADGEKFAGVLRQAGVKHERLTAKAAAQKFPQFNLQGVDWVLHEPEHGMLRARQGCQAVHEAFVAEGGTFRQQAVRPGDRFDTDQVVWACGPWMHKLFPQLLGKGYRASRQEVFFFGVPAGESIYNETRMPCWIDDATPNAHFYGTPGNDWRGFKIGDDAPGVDLDPDTVERRVSEDMLERIRGYMRRRFPKLAAAPLVETRVCQYELTRDSHFVMDRHPQLAGHWLLGGGSGHGYKMGPAVGERMAEIVLDKKQPEAMFAAKRLSA